MQESFLEARVVIFVINEDWLDSIPCNQEFEAVLTRKALLQPVDTKNAIILLDITNDRYNKRWGAKLPQLKAGLAHEAGKYFDVYNFTYNAQSTSQQKLAVQTDIISAVAKYMSKLVPPGGTGGIARPMCFPHMPAERSKLVPPGGIGVPMYFHTCQLIHDKLATRSTRLSLAECARCHSIKVLKEVTSKSTRILTHGLASHVEPSVQCLGGHCTVHGMHDAPSGALSVSGACQQVF
eukprot:352594-Chlamydomonas_euryale.AAC.12